jgi:hypothetical protein
VIALAAGKLCQAVKTNKTEEYDAGSEMVFLMVLTGLIQKSLYIDWI